MKPAYLQILLLALACAMPLRADVKVSSIFGDHMVLQREVAIPVWGTASPGEQITVSFGGENVAGTADANGHWKVKLTARPASATPRDLTIEGQNKIVYHDVLVGDVWIASGQSNMDWAFFWGNGVLNTDEEMAAADYPLIRDCKVGTQTQPEPQDDMPAHWIVCTPKHPSDRKFSTGIERFTAVGYFFARDLYRQLKIPIGLINSSLGGSMIEAWLDPDAVAQFPYIEERWQQRVAAYPDAKAKYDLAQAEWDSEKQAALSAGQVFNKSAPMAPSPPEQDIQRPAGLYNAMIHPFLGFAFKGAIWYQGENNAKHAEEYQKLFPALIQGWRRQFGEGDFPFYWVQLSNYDFQGRPDATEYAFLREAQTMTLALPKTGQAITLDIGDANEIHLHNKQEVGRRLALLALGLTYGYKDDVSSGPIFDHADLNANPVMVHFRNAAGVLKTKEDSAVIGGFELAGGDRIFHPAEAHIENGSATVSLSCDAVSKPVALRYAWHNDPKNLTLINEAGLPAAPFRTDNWPEVHGE
jgi:sialate O-acetylesterase